MDNVLDKLKFTDYMYKTLWDVKASQLAFVAEKVGATIDELKETLKKELAASGMHLGACNMAVDFLIIECEKEEATSTDKSLITRIREQVLGAAVYYANIAGGDPIYKGA